MCHQAIETSYASCHAPITQNKYSILMSHQNTKQVRKNWVFCHLGKLKTISNVGMYILSLQLNFTCMKSPVWQGKSPVTGHEPDSKKCLVCKPDLMFVTHLPWR